MMEVTKKHYNLQSLNFLRDTKLNIGILGGSFDPAHIGHFLISTQAIDFYKFDYIIWLVANQNPFKPKYTKSIFERASDATLSFYHPKIIITTVEHEFGTYYLYDSLTKLSLHFPNNNFTWLMGVDNLSHFPRWHKSEEIAKLYKIIVFDRPTKERFVNNCKFNLKFKAFLAKNQSTNIMIHRGCMCSTSSSLIRYF